MKNNEMKKEILRELTEVLFAIVMYVVLTYLSLGTFFRIALNKINYDGMVYKNPIFPVAIVIGITMLVIYTLSPFIIKTEFENIGHALWEISATKTIIFMIISAIPAIGALFTGGIHFLFFGMITFILAGELFVSVNYLYYNLKYTVNIDIENTDSRNISGIASKIINKYPEAKKHIKLNLLQKNT